jgi:hypothetical protein
MLNLGIRELQNYLKGDFTPTNFTSGPAVFGMDIGNMSGPVIPTDNLFKNTFNAAGKTTKALKPNAFFNSFIKKDKTPVSASKETDMTEDNWMKRREKEAELNAKLNEKYLKETGTQLKDLSQFQFLLGQMNKLPDRMSLGNMMKADAYKNQADRSVTSNIGLMSNMSLPLAGFRYDFQRFG